MTTSVRASHPNATGATDATVRGHRMQAAPGADGASLRPEPRALEEGHYQLWADRFERETGIVVDQRREPFVRRQLEQRLLELGLTDPDEYFASMLQTAAGEGERRLLLDRLLIKETRFFRHRDSHDFVRHIAQRHATAGENSLNVWSVGCSTGQEAYSLALDAIEGLGAAGRSDDFAVIGTDLSRSALREARAGTYPSHALLDLPKEYATRFLEPVGAGRFRFRIEVRSRLAFVVDNLLLRQRGFFPEGADIIFCQNLLIYFRRWRRHDTLNFLAQRLKPGGHLILGPGESHDWCPAGLTRVEHPGVAAYYRPADGETPHGR
ncbi:MAG: protein-glutamate O-methyltransferase CheR [Porticoccaceae bacterium]